jgi:hypothetical protein
MYMLACRLMMGRLHASRYDSALTQISWVAQEQLIIIRIIIHLYMNTTDELSGTELRTLPVL